MMNMWDIAKSYQGRRGLATFVGTMNTGVTEIDFTSSTEKVVVILLYRLPFIRRGK